jgi:uncharacterized protein YcbK (DUF882 family)
MARAAAALLLTLAGSAAATSSEIELLHLHTRERLVLPARRIPAPSVLNRFLRCREDRKYTLMDPRLVVAAMEAAQAFAARRVEIVSAFRTSRLNEAMRAARHRVAQRSRHIHGQALDLRLPGVSVEALCAHFRARHRGGVGCYEQGGFVHVDVGPPRTW